VHTVAILSAVIKHKISYTKLNVELTNSMHKIQKTHQTVMQNTIIEI